jgi:hypothetical protein
MMLRRLGVAVLLLLFLGAVSSAAAHGHLGGRDHGQSCAACTVAGASFDLASLPPTPAAPPPRLTPSTPRVPLAPPFVRPPLESAPKHGPPARI